MLSFIATIGNYDCSINWIFDHAGVLELDSERFFTRNPALDLPR